MADASTFQIPKDVIEPIIKAKVAAAVSDALGAHSLVLHEAVTRTLMAKVDTSGKPTSYGGGESFLDFIVSQALRDAVKSAVVEAIASHKATVSAAVLKEMQKKNSPLVKQLVEGMVSGVFDPKQIQYRVNVAVEARG